MKNLVIAILFVLFAGITASAQTVDSSAFGNSGGDFGMSKATPTGTTITVDGKTFDVSALPSGQQLIICKSPKTGNNYPVWIGKETSEVTSDGYQIRVSSTGKRFILKVSPKSGNPYALYEKAI